MSDGMRCLWQVTAGLIPNVIDDQFTRAWSMRSREFRDDDRMEKFLQTEAIAQAYARLLQLEASAGGPVNWVRTDFMWM